MDGPPPHLSEKYLHAYNGGTLIGITIVFLITIYVAVGLRFYCHHLIKVKWGVDDYLVLISLFLQTGAAAINFCGVKYAGNGYHLAALEETHPNLVPAFFKWLLAISSFYFFQVGWPKLAILVFYLRILTSKIQRKMVYFLIGIVITNGIICPIVSLTLCRPFAFNWDRTIPGGHCLNEQNFYRWGSFPNIITDIAILLLPLPMVWHLHNSRKIKLGLTLTFLLGGVGLVTSILRFDAFFQGNAVMDGTYDINLTIFSVVEPNIYLTAACLLTFRPLYQKIISRIQSIKNLTYSFTGKTSGSGTSHSAQTGSGAETKSKSLAGFRRLRKGDPESGGSMYDTTPGRDADHIQLVYMDNKLKDGDSVSMEPPAGQIKVRNDYFVQS